MIEGKLVSQKVGFVFQQKRTQEGSQSPTLVTSRKGSCRRSYEPWKNDLNGLTFNFQFLWEWVCQEREEKVVY